MGKVGYNEIVDVLKKKYSLTERDGWRLDS